MAVTFNKVIAKDGLTPAQRFATMTKQDGVFYLVGSELYLKNVLLSVDTAAELAVADAGNLFEGTDVEAVLAELAGMVGDQEVTVTKTTGGAGDDFVYRYTFSQGGTQIPNGVIDIAKDMVATDGELVYPTVDDPIVIGQDTITSGTYIKMTIANGSPFFINVADLIQYNTFADNDEFDFSDNSHQITVSVKKISGSKIIYRFADDGVTELTINQKVDQVESDLGTLTNYVGQIPGTSSATNIVDYIAEQTGGGIAALDGTADIAAKDASTNVITIKGGLVETDGVIGNAPTTGAGAKADVVLAAVAATGASEDVAVTDAGGYFEGSDVETILQEIGAQLLWNEV